MVTDVLVTGRNVPSLENKMVVLPFLEFMWLNLKMDMA